MLPLLLVLIAYNIYYGSFKIIIDEISDLQIKFQLSS